VASAILANSPSLRSSGQRPSWISIDITQGGGELVLPVTFYISGHPDDALFFRGEQLFTDLHSGGVSTVQIVASAGDAGRVDEWWQAREAACVEAMLGTLSPGDPVSTQVMVNDHPLQRYARPGWACYFLRLPDGNNRDDVEGFDSTDHLTMGKLQAESIPSLPTVDGSTTYTEWSDLVDTLRSIITREGGATPHPWVNTSDPDRGLNPRDHRDHYAVADAVAAFAEADGLNRVWWVSYGVGNKPDNLAGYALDIKWFLVRLYGWALDDLMATPPNEEEWRMWGAKTYFRIESA